MTDRSAVNRQERSKHRLPKLCGADIELGNFVLGLNRPGGTCYEASSSLLREIKGLPRQRCFQTPMCACNACLARRESQRWEPVDEHWTGERGRIYKVSSGNGSAISSSYDPQDWGRRFLPNNGGCVYVDLNHLELCLPEVISAYDHVACWHAMLRIGRRALEAANQKQPHGQRIQVLVNNSDGKDNSYGSHLNFLMTRRAWDNIFHRKIHQMLYLAAYQASSIVFTGQGKVGAENGAPPVTYQLSQRADFYETLTGTQTTFQRPIVNSRDEALCANLGYGQNPQGQPDEEKMARLHVIFFDNTLCHVASLLKVGVMQMLLAQIEAEHMNPNLVLDDPVDAVVRWSHDPTLQARARMVNGKTLTAIELQLLFLEEARSFSAAGGYDEIVPRAGEILALWENTLLKLKAWDLTTLSSRLDWALKLRILQRAMQQRPELNWDSPEIKHLDHLYSSLDRAEGLYWAYERSGLVEKVVSEAQIERFVQSPPEDTRAWTRAMLLRCAGPDAVDHVDWDYIRFKSRRDGYVSSCRTLDMPSPLAFTRSASEPIFRKARNLDDLVGALGAPEVSDKGDSSKDWLGLRGDHRSLLLLPKASQTPCSRSFPADANGKNHFNRRKGGYNDESS